MALVRTFRLPHYEDYPVQVAMFKDVTNAAFLRSQLLEANSEFDYAFLDASMILSRNHLLSATLTALHLFQTTRSKTRTPHSELVFRLSPNNNIGESYRKFGITDTSTSMIAVKFSLTEDVTAESVAEHLGKVVQGTKIEIGEEGEELGLMCDVELVRKVYKLGAEEKKVKKDAVVNGGAIGGGNDRLVMESVILGTIAMKGS